MLNSLASIKNTRKGELMNTQNDSQAHIPQYDAHLIPAESAARQHREGKSFGHTPHDEPNSESIHTTDGYTVDQEQGNRI